MLVAFRASAVGDTTPKSTIVASGSVQKRQVRANAKTEPTFHMPEDRKVITNYIMSNFLTSSYSVRLHDMYTYIYIYIYIYSIYIVQLKEIILYVCMGEKLTANNEHHW